MKRHQVRRMLAGSVTDAQIRRVITELGLPSADDHSYNDEEARQIISQFRKPQSDRLSQSQQSAEEAAEKTKVALVTGHQERLVALSNALEKAEQRRSEVLDRLSDRVAYLQDDSLFMNDLLRLAQSKLQQQQPAKQEVTVTALDALVEAFDAVGEWEIPAIASSSALGCLPM